MLKITGKLVSMEGALEKQLFINGVQNLSSSHAGKEARQHIRSPSIHTRPANVTAYWNSSVHPNLPKMSSNNRHALKVYAIRRSRKYQKSETYVLMERGQEERFVSEEELKAKLKDRLENWPGEALPPDLARFENIDDAVLFLVKSVCELEIDGNVGSIQWYEVRLD
ncbi:protein CHLORORESPIRATORY REDUCTION 7, chloroplastic isoform X1 [Quercus robur]|uniref:protein CHLORORESPIRATORY REDUCTION 7, chloroplastic isoform X1 n=1 Tax=Quercus robur TaxID=38942 RepID=UPI002162774B|nr:protein CHLORORESPIRATORY REDUCTION 7, chloroplastic isoform X1 [Quercus robur]